MIEQAVSEGSSGIAAPPEPPPVGRPTAGCCCCGRPGDHAEFGFQRHKGMSAPSATLVRMRPSPSGVRASVSMNSVPPRSCAGRQEEVERGARRALRRTRRTFSGEVVCPSWASTSTRRTRPTRSPQRVAADPAIDGSMGTGPVIAMSVSPPSRTVECRVRGSRRLRHHADLSRDRGGRHRLHHRPAAVLAGLSAGPVCT